jgi:excisionase family DNA binding protein
MSELSARVNGSASPEASSHPRGLTRAELMTAAQVAELLDVPVSTVREWGRRGILPRVKLGRHVRFLAGTDRGDRARRTRRVAAVVSTPSAAGRVDGRSNVLERHL